MASKSAIRLALASTLGWVAWSFRLQHRRPATQAQYQLAPVNTDACPSGTTGVLSQQECASLATVFCDGAFDDNVSNSDWPSGCYQKFSGKSSCFVYFNEVTSSWPKSGEIPRFKICDTQRYQLAPDGTNTCPADTIGVLSQQECASLATTFCDGGFGDAVSNPAWPAGCYQKFSCKSSCMVYFNTLASTSPTRSPEIPRFRVCEPQKYQLVQENTNTCPAGTAGVLNQQDCASLATTFCDGGSGGSVSSPDWPSGCYQKFSGRSTCMVFFNQLTSTSPTSDPEIPRFKVCEKEEHQLAQESTNKCPAGTAGVLNQQECASLATKFCDGGFGSSISNSDWPGGCYQKFSGRSNCQLFFNRLTLTSPTSDPEIPRFKVCEPEPPLAPPPQPSPAPCPLPSPSVVLKRVGLDHIDPGARCTDDTLAAYFWKPSTNNASFWTVNLRGGGWCFDQGSCGSRCPHNTNKWLCSNKSYPEELSQNGILADYMLDANVADVPYCSSDGHMGNGSAFGYNFHGSRILQAVLKDLVRKGLAGSSGHTIILSGQSAGARGAMVNLDYIQEMVAVAGGTSDVEVVGFLDGAIWMDIDNYPNSGSTGLAEMSQGVFAIANTTHLGPECAAAYPGAEGWKCLFAHYRLPLVRTPYFAHMSPHDSYQLGVRMGSYPWNSESTSWAVNYGSQIQSFMRSLRANWPANATRQNAVHGWNCWDHAISLQDRGYNQQHVRGVTVGQAFRIFLGLEQQTDASPPNEWLDDCEGFNCGAGCRPP